MASERLPGTEDTARMPVEHDDSDAEHQKSSGSDSRPDAESGTSRAAHDRTRPASEMLAGDGSDADRARRREADLIGE